MTITRYPRPGYPIAPSCLAVYLERPAPFNAGPFRGLNCATWSRFPPKTCFALASALVNEVKRQRYTLEIELSNTPVPVPAGSMRLKDLELEVRTYKCLQSKGISILPNDLSGLSIADLFEIKSFGIKSLVDLLTAIEPFQIDPHFTVPRTTHPVVPEDVVRTLEEEESVPAYLRCCVLPQLPGAMKLEHLRLGTRTFNILSREGFSEHSERIGGLTVEELLNFRGFGIDCLIDLVQSLNEEMSPSSIPTNKKVWKIAPENIGTLVENEALLPTHLLNARIPTPKHVQHISKLGLQKRTHNTLNRYDLTRVANLSGLTIQQALDIRGFGVGCLVDLVESIYRIGIEEEKHLPVERKHLPILRSLVPRNIRSLARVKGWQPFKQMILPQFPDEFMLQELQLELKVFNALDKAGFTSESRTLSGTTIRELLNVSRLGPRGVCDVVEASYRYLDMESPQRSSRTFDQIVLDCIVPSRNERNRAIAMQYLGLGTHDCSTLEEVGCSFGITRERVRQIVSRDADGLHELGRTPVVAQIVEIIRDRIPCRAAHLEALLAVEGIIGKGTKLEAILRVFDIANLPRPCELLGSRGSQIAITEEHVSEATMIRSVAVKQTRKFGCTHIDAVHQYLPKKVVKRVSASLITSIVKNHAGFRWLDQESGWFWLKRKKGSNRLKNRIQKVLCVAPKISIAELRGALRRDYRAYVVPPVRVLREFCDQISGCHVSGEFVVSDEIKEPDAVLKGDELLIVKILLAKGPVCRRRELQRWAQEKGVSTPSFWQCVNYRPTITRFATGVYGLTGATAPPDLIESMRPVGPRRRVLLDHGWSDDGKIWIAYEASQALIETGIINIPGGKKSYLQGQYELLTPGGARLGTLTVRDHLAWGLGRFVRRVTIEPGDVMLFTFAPSAKQATIETGDGGLIDQLTDEY